MSQGTYAELEDYEAGYKDGRAGKPCDPPPFASQAYYDGYDDGVNDYDQSKR